MPQAAADVTVCFALTYQPLYLTQVLLASCLKHCILRRGRVFQYYLPVFFWVQQQLAAHKKGPKGEPPFMHQLAA